MKVRYYIIEGPSLSKHHWCKLHKETMEEVFYFHEDSNRWEGYGYTLAEIRSMGTLLNIFEISESEATTLKVKLRMLRELQS